MKIPKRTVTFPDSQWRLLTEVEFDELETRANAKPQIPAEVIERAREWLNDSMSDADLAGAVVAGREVVRDLLTRVEATEDFAPDFNTMHRSELLAWLAGYGHTSEVRALRALARTVWERTLS